MPDQWEFKSRTYDNCNCDMNCGCQFNLPSTHGYCETAYVGTVEEGHFNETPLAGLKWAGLWKWPGEIGAGNGTRQIIIDERADEAQRVALKAIISDYTRETLDLLRDRGIAYTVATGRTLHAARKPLEGHDFPLPQIYKNGVMIWHPADQAYSHKYLLTKDEVK